ncbi:uncharacterized protein LOC108865134 [Galendromus occidentalis]|uniref:Uncharacterized protein LOC108865134 n=1 Tax=Galendromus occidentalis TaxID=34638 RepID=A0AAJ7PB26_9ACAR|nr:uncharacterized protein LOC108865134 [Galendromus occidentalis]
MCDAPIIYMDGTFRVVPTLFTQLYYTLHGEFKGAIIPFAYFLLPDKRKETYIRMFDLLTKKAIEIGRAFCPQTIQVYYEVATLGAIGEMFPVTDRTGCLFYFSQCLRRKVQNLGLVTHYADPSVRRFLKSIAAMALVPADRMRDAWLEFNAEAPGPDNPAYQRLEEFKLYFIRTWLENASVSPCASGPRTTNHLEGWHHALNQTVKKRHLNSFEMVAHLQKQEEKFRLNMMMLRMGKPAPSQRKTIGFSMRIW